MQILEDTPYRLHIEFRGESRTQILTGIAFGIFAFLVLRVLLAGGEGWLPLMISTVFAVYCLATPSPYGCWVDRNAGQLTILRRNSLGQQYPLTYPLTDIDAVTVTRRMAGRGNPCSADVCLKSGRRTPLMAYESCAVQRQVTERITDFLQL